MKSKIFLLLMGILFTAPGIGGAVGTVPNTHDHFHDQECDCEAEEGSQHHKRTKDWQSFIAEREKQLLGYVNQFTPEKKAEWTKVLEEKKQLRNKWMSPENAAKREQWHKEKMEKMQKLRKQLEEGKITKQEFVKQIHGGKDMGHWKSFHELEIAAEKKETKQATTLLNQLLRQYEEHNKRLKELLAK
ncbi:hypothetical protein [Neobacillus sp. LXY-1]|uniref:hypothetical protein n=1 Tax=Neobacillus sp. LXY-1 TaxID=3379133 RepID=UPI003EE10422